MRDVQNDSSGVVNLIILIEGYNFYVWNEQICPRPIKSITNAKIVIWHSWVDLSRDFPSCASVVHFSSCRICLNFIFVFAMQYSKIPTFV